MSIYQWSHHFFPPILFDSNPRLETRFLKNSIRILPLDVTNILNYPVILEDSTGFFSSSFRIGKYIIPGLLSSLPQYCWWLKSGDHHLGWCWNPINNGINYLSTGAGFQPSTVSQGSYNKTSSGGLTVFFFFWAAIRDHQQSITTWEFASCNTWNGWWIILVLVLGGRDKKSPEALEGNI